MNLLDAMLPNVDDVAGKPFVSRAAFDQQCSIMLAIRKLNALIEAQENLARRGHRQVTSAEGH